FAYWTLPHGLRDVVFLRGYSVCADAAPPARRRFWLPAIRVAVDGGLRTSGARSDHVLEFVRIRPLGRAGLFLLADSFPRCADRQKYNRHGADGAADCAGVDGGACVWNSVFGG